MYKRISQVYFIADTKDDLILIPDPKMNDECFVIQDACEYKAMSTGEWVKQVPSSSTGSEGNSEIDLSAYATIEYVDSCFAADEDAPSWGDIATKEELDNAIGNIQIPSVEGFVSKEYVDEAIAQIETVPAMKMFAEDPAIMASNPGSQFGIALNNGDTRTLPEAMLEKGVGMYNFWIHKSNPSLPAKAIEKNSSCRGICCVDTIKPTGWYGWALLFDQDGDTYSQYIRNSEPKGWKHFVTD